MMDIIDGVQALPLAVNEDDRGYLYEVIHSTDKFMHKFGQVYMVGDRTPGIIRAFHKHKVLWDYFHICHGAAKFVLVDDRPESKTFKKINTFILSDKKPQLLVVPPGVHHGWMSLENDTLLLSTGSEVYSKEKPDEERIPHDSFGDLWSIKPK